MNAKDKIEAGLLQQTRHKGDAADEALALLQDCIVIPKGEVPANLQEWGTWPHDCQMDDPDMLVDLAKTILKRG